MTSKLQRLAFAVSTVLMCLTLASWALQDRAGPTPDPAKSFEIEGSVFIDDNRNGIRDPAEPGVEGVAVSDQHTVTRTDREGRYQFNSDGATGLVFVSQPNSYRVRGSFWKPVQGPARVDFALVPTPAASSFTFLHASDTHISPETLPRTRKLRTLVESLHPDFVLVTGDLVRDALRVPERQAREYYELYTSEIAQFPVPVYSVPGNHENFGIERHLSLVSPRHPLYGKGMYRHYLGPTYYSFNYGGVHFIGLDSVDIDDLWYYGHVDAAQLAWLRQDVAADDGSSIVTFNHIPFFTAALSVFGYFDDPPAPTLIKIGDRTVFRHVVSNPFEVFKILAPHHYILALGGHNHAAEKLTFKIQGLNVRFHQTAAVVGPNTYAPMPIPSGVTLYSVSGGVIDDGRFLPLDEQE